MNQFGSDHTKIVLGDFNAEIEREEIIKPTIEKESLYEILNNN